MIKRKISVVLKQSRQWIIRVHFEKFSKKYLSNVSSGFLLFSGCVLRLFTVYLRIRRNSEQKFEREKQNES